MSSCSQKAYNFLVREHIVSAYGEATVINREFPGILFCSYLFILVLCLPVHKKHKHFLVWEHIVSDHGSDTALNREFLGISLYLFVFINFMSSCS